MGRHGEQPPWFQEGRAAKGAGKWEVRLVHWDFRHRIGPEPGYVWEPREQTQTPSLSVPGPAGHKASKTRGDVLSPQNVNGIAALPALGTP